MPWWVDVVAVLLMLAGAYLLGHRRGWIDAWQELRREMKKPEGERWKT